MKVAAFVVDQSGDIAFRAHVLWQVLAWHELQRFIAIMPCCVFLPVGQQPDALPQYRCPQMAGCQFAVDVVMADFVADIGGGTAQQLPDFLCRFSPSAASMGACRRKSPG
jgi:hypothetical protein